MDGLDKDIQTFMKDMEIAHDIIHGDDTTTVLTEAGVTPSLAKALKDGLVDPAGQLSSAVEAATAAKDQAIGAAASVAWIISETPPASPVPGKDWIKASTGKRYTYMEDGTGAGQWVEIAGFYYIDDFGSVKQAEEAAEDAREILLAVEEEVGKAATQVSLATDQAVAAGVSASQANLAKLAAEAARDAANTSGKVFTSTALGLGGTTSGQSFSVLDTSGFFWNVYLNNVGTAQWLSASYTKTYLDQSLPNIYESIDPLYSDSKSMLLLDSAKRVLGQFPDARVATLASSALKMVLYETLDTSIQGAVLTDSKNRIVLTLANMQASIAALNSSAVISYYYETLETTYSMALVDSQKRILATVTAQTAITAVQNTLASAAGSTADLPTRLSHGLTVYGDPLGPYGNKWALRETRMRLCKRAIGESSQLIIACIGDSYTQAPSRYVGPLAKRLQDTYGLAGVGWLGFGWFGTASGTWASGSQPTGKDIGARYDLITNFDVIGTWTCAYNDATTNTPSLSVIKSSTAGDYVRFTVPADHHACRLYYGGDGTGVVQVSWDDGATYSANLALNTVGAANVALTGIPATAVVARIKVISGNVWLAGVDLQSNNPGVRVHKLGGSGSSLTTWVGATAATWAAQIQQLGSHLHQVMHGTNDQGGAVVPSTFATRLSTLFTTIKSVLPYSDRLVMMPAENQRTNNTYPMTAYAQAAREYALANDAAYCDLQYFFGSPANNAFEYSYANTVKQWYASDLIHPDPLTGGRVIVDAEYRLLTTQ